MSHIRPDDLADRARQRVGDRGAVTAADPAARRHEIMMFLLLAVVIWPFLAIAIVGGYGFLVWMVQLILGPPGPPTV